MCEQMLLFLFMLCVIIKTMLVLPQIIKMPAPSRSFFNSFRMRGESFLKNELLRAESFS